MFGVSGMQNSGGPTFCLLYVYLTKHYSHELQQTFVGDCSWDSWSIVGDSSWDSWSIVVIAHGIHGASWVIAHGIHGASWVIAHGIHGASLVIANGFMEHQLKSIQHFP